MFVFEHFGASSVRSLVRSFHWFVPSVCSIHSFHLFVGSVRSFIHSLLSSFFVSVSLQKTRLAAGRRLSSSRGNCEFWNWGDARAASFKSLVFERPRDCERLNFQWINSDRYGWMMQYRARVSFLFVQKRGTSVIFSLWNYPASFSCFWWMKNLRLFSPISFSANRIYGGDWSPGACWTQQTQSSVVDAPWPH